MARKKTVKSKTTKKARKPREAALPGMENMHHPKLGPLAAQVAEIRKAMADARAEEDEILPGVLKIMHDENKTTFHAHGVIFTREVGAEKLRVKSSGAKGKQTTADA